MSTPDEAELVDQELVDTAAAGAPTLPEDDDVDLVDDDAPAVDPAEQSPPAPEAGAQDLG